MTHVISTSVLSALRPSTSLKEYQVEVVTYDGESETVYVEAYTDEEAHNLAAAQVPDADYTMIQGAWEV